MTFSHSDAIKPMDLQSIVV